MLDMPKLSKPVYVLLELMRYWSALLVSVAAMGMRITKQKAAESTMIFKAVDNHKTHGQDK